MKSLNKVDQIVNIYKNTYYYQMIEKMYRNIRAKRSKLPYINHINEGITILHFLKAPHGTIEGFCLHPLFQGDVELSIYSSNKQLLALMGPNVIIDVLEYRNCANSYLAKHLKEREPALSPIDNVNWMLLADKIQNYKDFLKYQSFTGDNPTMTKEKWEDLDLYFQKWLHVLVPYFGFSFNKEIEEVWKIIDDDRSLIFETL